jgi:hypothetical protein
MKVVFVSGPHTGDEMEVDRELIVGREESDLEIEDTTVSRRHAAFRPTDEGVELEDLGSTNGTFVNGARIDSPVSLQPGDFVSIGNSTFEVRGDWHSVETEAIAIPAQIGTPAADEDEIPTSQLSVDAVRETRSQIPRTWLAAAAAALVVIVALIFVFSNGDDEVAAGADDLCRRESRALGEVPLRGPRIQENAGRIVSVRVLLRKELGQLAADGDEDAFAAFLTKYAETNGRLRRLSDLPARAKPAALRRASAAVRESAAEDARAATSAGLEVCGGLPV